MRTKHLRAEPAEPSDGTRILVSRFRPRGIAKGRETWHEWRPELGPSRGLHAAVKQGMGLEEYRARFLREMGGPEARAALAELARRAAGGEVLTLLCDHLRSAPPEGCHRFLVARLVEERLAGAETA